jgi:hypothetical protein
MDCPITIVSGTVGWNAQTSRVFSDHEIGGALLHPHGGTGTWALTRWRDPAFRFFMTRNK